MSSVHYLTVENLSRTYKIKSLKIFPEDFVTNRAFELHHCSVEDISKDAKKSDEEPKKEKLPMISYGKLVSTLYR